MPSPSVLKIFILLPDLILLSFKIFSMAVSEPVLFCIFATPFSTQRLKIFEDICILLSFLCMVLACLLLYTLLVLGLFSCLLLSCCGFLNAFLHLCSVGIYVVVWVFRSFILHLANIFVP